MYSGNFYWFSNNIKNFSHPFLTSSKEPLRLEFTSYERHKMIEDIPDISYTTTRQSELSNDPELSSGNLLFSERIFAWMNPLLELVKVRKAYYEDQLFFLVYAPYVAIPWNFKNESLTKLEKVRGYLTEKNHIFRIEAIKETHTSKDPYDYLSEEFVKRLEIGKENYGINGFSVTIKD